MPFNNYRRKFIRPSYDKELSYEIDSSNAFKYYLCLKLLSLQQED